MIDLRVCVALRWFGYVLPSYAFTLHALLVTVTRLFTRFDLIDFTQLIVGCTLRVAGVGVTLITVDTLLRVYVTLRVTWATGPR